MPASADFREVGHCGGRLTVVTTTDDNGCQQHRFRLVGSSPTPAAWFGIYALPPGIAAGNLVIGGIGAPFNPPPFPGCYPVFIGSDSEGRFGHKCPRCNGYWRSDGAPARWSMTCPYCGGRGATYMFRTDGQLRYVEAVCDLVALALDEQTDGERTIDFDRAADDAASTSATKPPFYYVETSQQQRFTCSACGAWNDVLGRYAYCSVCGTRNDFQELEKTVARIRDEANAGSPLDGCVRDLVGAFDSVARQYVKQLVSRIPITERRRALVEGKLFHNVKPRAAELLEVFDIDIWDGISSEDVNFAVMMFCRRHVYEHNGGEADERYIQESGDTSVRPKQVIRETRENAHRVATIITRMTRNLHVGFHALLPPEPTPIEMERERRSRQKAATRRTP